LLSKLEQRTAAVTIADADADVVVVAPRRSQKYSTEKRTSSFNSPRHGSGNLRAATLLSADAATPASLTRARTLNRIEKKITPAIDRAALGRRSSIIGKWTYLRGDGFLSGKY